MDDEDEVDGDHIDYESTDSMTSTTHLPPDFIIPPKKEVEVAPPYLIKRSSSSVFYTGRACTSHQSSQQVQLQCCCWCHFSKLWREQRVRWPPSRWSRRSSPPTPPSSSTPWSPSSHFSSSPLSTFSSDWKHCRRKWTRPNWGRKRTLTGFQWVTFVADTQEVHL